MTLVNRLARTAELMRITPHVYGAALAASRDERAAALVTEGVLSEAAAEFVIDRDRLVERAIVLAVGRQPAAAFAAMDVLGRKAVALACLAGYSSDQVARTLGIAHEAAKASMLAALRGRVERAAS